MEYLGSMYIDNELDLEEKVEFVEKIRSEEEFFQETVALLLQEKLLRTIPEKVLIQVESRIRPDRTKWLEKFFRPLAYVGTGFALAMLFLFLQATVPTDKLATFERFVI